MSKYSAGVTSWRDPGNKKWRVKSLFYETAPEKNDAIYTLGREDRLGLKSLYKLYMEEEDLTELNFANKYLGGWSHWKYMIKSPHLGPLIKEWREELEIKMMAKGLKIINETIHDEQSKPSDRMFAAKYFANREWARSLTKTTPGAKRAKKGDLIDKLVNSADDDFERLIGNVKSKPN